RGWRLRNKERFNELRRSWERRNRSRINARKAARAALQLLATPAWADLEAIKDVYAEAEYLGLEVDHIVPLKHHKVCGLHTWDNLQLLSGEDNRKKGNRWWPDMAIADEGAAATLDLNSAKAWAQRPFP